MSFNLNVMKHRHTEKEGCTKDLESFAPLSYFVNDMLTPLS